MIPRYTGFAVITIDGKIARNDSHYVDWSSREDKLFLRKKLDASDVIVIGRKTFDTLKARTKKISNSRRYIVLTHRVKKTVERNNVLYCNADAVSLDGIIRERKYRRVSVLGGAHVYQAMLNMGLLNEFYITVEPIVFGKGISLLIDSVDKHTWKLVSVKHLNRFGTLLLRYNIS